MCCVSKDFDKKVQAKGRRGQALEGQLHKWTNPLKGWQPRWFVVDLQQSVLHYYTVSLKDCGILLKAPGGL